MTKGQVVRTSISHPLRIDIESVPGSKGLIGMTLCPGRRDSLSVEGPWARDLATDLAAIVAWEPFLVITLVEEFEFAMLGASEFPETLLRSGLRWKHLPIRDAGIPDVAFEQLWLATGAEARSALRADGRVLLHCRAGLGRTGTIAARLLVELGSSPESAIAMVRNARPGAIETRAQERHVRDCTIVVP